MVKHLVIVESPAKAKTLARFLGPEYMVESSIGHVRDLPSKAAEIPTAQRSKPWSRLGVNIEADFEPLYIVPLSKKKQVKKLKDLLKKADDLYLATDEDREGEAIAWHLLEVLKPRIPVRRMVFHEITKKAVEQALGNTRDLDTRLVQAQEARRILDRLFGYELSPVLWKKVRPRLSAGRVQSVATRLVVQRELERRAFHVARYWGVEADLITQNGQGPRRVTGTLVELGGKRLAQGRDFSPSDGKLTAEAQDKGIIRLSERAARALEQVLGQTPYRVHEVTRKPFTQKPTAPFITSTLQQEASRKLSYSTQRTMRVAQRLYENGFITYMRTDATTLSEQAVVAARKQIAALYGQDYLPPEPRTYAKKVKGAQEAHEAIRPAGEEFRTPESLRGDLDAEAMRLYDLIWKRTMACQMKDAQGERSRIRFAAEVPTEVSEEAGQPVDGQALLQASGKVITFPGYLRAYVEGSDDPDTELGDKEVILPALNEGDPLSADAVRAAGHSTKPPARFTEASLVKELEQLGIGRPSTYASTIQTIQDRGYVWKRSGSLMPTLTALAVTRLLEKHFDELVDYDFTARMESDLDAISSGEKQAGPWLKLFYFGAGNGSPGQGVRQARLEEVGVKAKIEQGIEDIDAREICTLTLGEIDGVPVAARVGRYGPYLEVGEGVERASIPEEMPLDELDLDRAAELLRAARDANRPLGQHPETGQTIQLKSGRYGPYVQLGEAVGKDKPRMASLWPDMIPAELGLEEALLLLSYPRVIGQHPEHGAEVTADSGQYGPYISMVVDGKRDSRSLADHQALRELTLEQAVALFAQPKQRRQRGQAAGPILELPDSPVTGKPIQVRNGRFGPYVTDGQVNASIRSGRDPLTITFDDALELIAAREQRMRDEGKDPRGPKASTRKGAGKAVSATAGPAAKKTRKSPKAKGPQGKKSGKKATTSTKSKEKG